MRSTVKIVDSGAGFGYVETTTRQSIEVPNLTSAAEVTKLWAQARRDNEAERKRMRTARRRRLLHFKKF